MAKSHSYTSTLNNNISENEALTYLLGANEQFKRPNKEERKKIMLSFGLGNSFARAFDLIQYSGAEPYDIDNIAAIKDKMILIELKTKKKKLANNPNGFFFGATENEFKLAELMGDKYKFCFVSLHHESLSYKLLSISELNQIIKTKRVQYQINL